MILHAPTGLRGIAAMYVLTRLFGRALVANHDLVEHIKSFLMVRGLELLNNAVMTLTDHFNLSVLTPSWFVVSHSACERLCTGLLNLNVHKIASH